jgi:hypothetical protein
VSCLFSYFGAFVNGFNKKYRNLFYDSSWEAVVGEGEANACGGGVSRAGGAGGLRGRVAVLEDKERLSLRNVVDKSREPRQWRRGYVTNEPVRRKQ